MGDSRQRTRHILDRDHATSPDLGGQVFAEIFQFSDVPRPVIVQEGILNLGRKPKCDLWAACPPNEELCQRENVLSAIAQRWHIDLKHIEAEEQVLTELSQIHKDVKITIRCREYSQVNLPNSRFPNPAEFSRIQESEQLDLSLCRQISNLVEQDGSRVRRLEKPFFVSLLTGIPQISHQPFPTPVLTS